MTFHQHATTRPCKLCGAKIFFAVTHNGRNVALNVEPERRYALAQDSIRRDPSEPRVEYWKTYQCHSETCEALKKVAHV